MVDSPLRREFEEYVKSYCKQWEVEFILAKCNDGEYESNETDLQWIGYHDRALQENLKLRDATVVAEKEQTRPSDQKIIEVLAEKFGVDEIEVIVWLDEMDLEIEGNRHCDFEGLGVSG